MSEVVEGGGGGEGGGELGHIYNSEASSHSKWWSIYMVEHMFGGTCVVMLI